MSRTAQEMIAHALEMEEALVPHAEWLLQDLEELGGDAELVVEVLEELGVSQGSRIIDVGCGKGAVAFEIADELGASVLGIDLHAPFVDYASREAARRGLEDRCRFLHADGREAWQEHAGFDVAVMMALGDVMGSVEETMRTLRNYVRPGGYIVVGDGFVRDEKAAKFAGFEGYRERSATLAALTANGDEVCVERVEDEEGADLVDEDTPLIAARAAQLAAQHPELAEILEEFVADQGAEVAWMHAHFVSVTWALRRGPD